MPVVLGFTQIHLRQLASYPTLGQALSVHELVMVQSGYWSLSMGVRYMTSSSSVFPMLT